MLDGQVRVLLCDADGNLFGSEEPAFEASAEVTNAALAELGVDARYAPEELRRLAMGRSFRGTMGLLAEQHGVAVDDAWLERWAHLEREAVTAHLRRTLAPDPEVTASLERLAERFVLALVSSSAGPRLDACLQATGLGHLFPAERRFSAETSLPVPASKPDPAIYRHAGAALGVRGDGAVAIEDAVAGVRSAREAGFPVIGNLCFTGDGEREERRRALTAAGCAAVVPSWSAVEALQA